MNKRARAIVFSTIAVLISLSFFFGIMYYGKIISGADSIVKEKIQIDGKDIDFEQIGDKLKGYDNDTQTIYIKDKNSKEDLFSAKLTTPKINKVPVGYVKVAEIEGDKNFSRYLEYFTLINLKTNKTFERKIDVKYLIIEDLEVDDIKTVCKVDGTNGSNEACYNEVFGKKGIKKEKWVDLNDSAPEGKLTIGLFTTTINGESAEWIPTLKILNDEISVYEWASWDSNLETSIVGWWTMNESTGSTAPDVTGNGNAGTYNGDLPTNTTGIYNGGQYFDGTDDDVTFASRIGNGAGALSLAFWINITSQTNKGIFRMDTSSGGDWYLYKESDSKITFFYYTGTGVGGNVYPSDTNLSLTPGTWEHIVLTKDSGASDIKIYINGIFHDTVVAISSSSGRSAITQFGADTTDNIKAEFDEVAIWERALTSDEVTTLYNEGLGCTWQECASLISVTLNNPINNQNLSSSSITFSVTPSESTNPLNTSIYGNWSGTWALNVSNSSSQSDNETNFTISGITDGKYIWNAYVNDSENNTVWGTTNYTFTKDTTPPTSTLPLYTNGTVKKNSATLILNVSLTDATLSPSYCKVNVNGTNITSNATNGWCNISNVGLSGLSEGNNSIKIYANDTLNNWGLNTNYSVDIDDTVPTLDYNPSSDTSGYYSRDYILINISSTDTHLNATRLSWDGTNESFSSSAGSNYWSNKTGLADDNYTVYGWANDSAGNYYLLSTHEIVVDTTNPTINLTYPLNISYNTDVNRINYTITDLYLDSCWYSLDKGVTNSSPDSSCSNFTSLSSVDGQNNWTIYANDTAGNIASDTVYFTKDTTKPTIHLISPSNHNYSRNLRNTFEGNITDNLNIHSLELYVVNSTGDRIFNHTDYDNFSGSSLNQNLWANRTSATGSGSGTATVTVTDGYVQALSSTSTPDFDSSADVWALDLNQYENITSIEFIYYLNYRCGNDVSGSATSKVTGFGVTLDSIATGCGGGGSKSDTHFGTIKLIKNDTKFDLYINNSLQSQITPTTNNLTIETDASLRGSPVGGNSATARLYYVNYSAPTLLSGTENSTTFTFDFTDYGEGNYTWDLNGRDFYNNTNFSNEGNYTIVIDTTNPLISYGAGTTTNASNPPQDYIYVNTSLTEINFGNMTFYLYNTTDLVSEVTFTNSTRDFNFTSLPDETYYFNVTTYDRAGNFNQTDTYTIFLDFSKPTINFVSPTSNQNSYFNRTYIEINSTATDNALSYLTIRLFNGTNSSLQTNVSSSSPYFINYTTLSDGTYFYNVSANDTAGNTNSTETRKITLDSVAPVLSLTNPASGETLTSATNINLNFTVTDANTHSCWFKVLDGSNNLEINNQSISNCENTTFNLLSTDSYFITLYANDSVGHLTSLETFFRVSFENPSVTLSTPSNASWDNTPTNVNFSFTASDFDGIDYCKLYSNFTGSWEENETFTFVTSGIPKSTLKNLDESTYIWASWCNDTVGFSSFSTNFTFYVDTTIPNTTVTTENDTVESSLSYTFDYNITDDRQLSSCYFSLYDDSGDLHNYEANTSLTCGNGSKSIATLSQGSFDLVVGATDEAGNVNLTTINFSTTLPGNPSIGSGKSIGTSNLGLAINFSIKTENNKDKLDFFVSKDSTKPKEGKFFLINKGLESITVEVGCNSEEVEKSSRGLSACNFVYFPETKFTIPPNEQQVIPGDFYFRTPGGAEYGETYYFNIVAVESSNTLFSKISVSAKVSKWAIFYRWSDRLARPFQEDIPQDQRFQYPVFPVSFVSSTLLSLGLIVVFRKFRRPLTGTLVTLGGFFLTIILLLIYL